MQRCEEYDILGFVKGEVRGRDAQVISTHLLTCASCSNHADDIKMLFSSLSSLEDVSPRKDFSNMLAQRVTTCAQIDFILLLRGRIQRQRSLQIVEHVKGCSYCHHKLIEARFVLSALKKLPLAEPSEDFVEDTVAKLSLINPETRQGLVKLMLSRMVKLARARVIAASGLFSFVVHAIILIIFALLVTQNNVTVTEESHFISTSQPVKKSKSLFVKLDTYKKEFTKEMSGPDVEISRYKEVTTEHDSFESFNKQPAIPPMFVPKFSSAQYRFDNGIGNMVQMRQDSASEQVVKGLIWLEKCQSQDGGWNVSLEGGKQEYRIGVTALAILGFLSEGSHNKAGRFKEVISRGVDYLLSNQNESGLIAQESGRYMYNHGLATIALGECYMLSQDESLRSSIKKAIDYIVAAQMPDGGWGYQITSEYSDTSIVCFQVMALRTAYVAGIKSSSIQDALKKAKKRTIGITDEEGRVGYTKKGQFAPELGHYTLTAMGALSYVLSSVNVDWEMMNKYRNVIYANELPVHSNGKKNDLLFPYFSALFLHQLQDSFLKEWSQDVNQMLLKMQKADGSWPDGLDRWYGEGGRIYTTALVILIIQSPTRYPRLVT